jgi:hypothetical protein
MDDPRGEASREVSKLLDARLTGVPIEERLDALAMSQVYSFWREMQDALQEAAAEIRRLKEKQ